MAEAPLSTLTVSEPCESDTAAECVRKLSHTLQFLESAGLFFDPAHPSVPEAVEQILITDDWSCRTCGRTDLRTCPATDKPHRRHLVRVAQEVLRLVGARAGQPEVRPAGLSSSLSGRLRLRVRRRVAMNPQALLLAYYYAVLPPAEVDPMLRECALHLVELLAELRRCGAQADVDEEFAAALLSSAAVTWSEYARKAAEDLRASSGADRRACAAVLVGGTKEAFLAASRELRRAPGDAHLRAFVAILQERLARLAPQEELDELAATLRDEQDAQHLAQTQAQVQTQDQFQSQVQDQTQAQVQDQTQDQSLSQSQAQLHAQVQSQVQAPRPVVLLSDGHTSGSDTEPRRDLAAPMGPALPPRWFVDESGRSRPPRVDPAEQRRELYLRLEFRARKAYESVITIGNNNNNNGESGSGSGSGTNGPQDAMARALGDAQLALLAEQFNRRPPDLQSVPRLLSVVIEGLLDALPRGLRARVEQEVRDVLDWRIVRRSVMASAGNIAALMRYVMGKVAEFGAPAKEAETMRRADEMQRQLEDCSPDLGTAAASAFRLMLTSIRQLHEDVARYSLLSITPHLRENAVGFIREFVIECFPAVAQWDSSLAFLRKYFADERVVRHASSLAAASSTALTEGERRMRAGVLYGALDLLRSGGLQSADRWRDYPAECLFFEKSVVFYAANAVQESSLLLLLSGSISTVLRGKGIDSRAINDALKDLHDKFLRLLGEGLTLPYLKTAMTNLVNEALQKIHGASALTEAEVNQLHGTLERMTDTSGSLYATFEKRVLQFIEASVAHSQSDVAPLGLVTDSLRRVATLINHMLVFNWEVYQPFYGEILPLLTQNTNTPSQD